MTKDDLMKMTLEAGEYADTHHEKHGSWLDAERHQFANLVASAEREACAGLRKEIVLIGGPFTEYESGFWDALEHYEDAIRARSQS